MRKWVNIYMLVGAAALVFGACNGDTSNEFVANPNLPVNDTSWSSAAGNISTVDAAFPLPPAAEEVLDNTANDTIFTPSFDAYFPAFSVINNGQAVNGSVDSKISFVRKKGDCIKLGRGTVDIAGNPLELGFALSFRAWQGSTALAYSQTSNPTVFVRTNTSSTNWQLFYGHNVNSSTIPVNTWRVPNDNSNFQWVNTIGNVGYFVDAKNTQFFGLLRAVDTPNGTARLNVILPLNYTNKNTSVYIVLASTNCVLKLQADAVNKVFFANKVPNGMPATLVVASKIGDDYFYNSRTITTAPGLIFNVVPQASTQAAITAALDAL